MNKRIMINWELLKQARTDLKYTQTELAELSWTTKTTIISIENWIHQTTEKKFKEILKVINTEYKIKPKKIYTLKDFLWTKNN